MNLSITLFYLFAAVLQATANPIDQKPCEITGVFVPNGQSCNYHPYIAAGQCIDSVNTQHEGDYCDAPQWGARGCGPGNDGNILVCDARNDMGMLMWRIFANCTEWSGGYSANGCEECQCQGDLE